MPSSVIAAIKKEYLDNDEHKFELLKSLTLDFDEETNNLRVFYAKELQLNENLSNFGDFKLNVSDLVINYIEEKKLLLKNGKFIRNVISNIFVEFTDGFIINDLNFADMETEFIVKG